MHRRFQQTMIVATGVTLGIAAVAGVSRISAGRRPASYWRPAASAASAPGEAAPSTRALPRTDPIQPESARAAVAAFYDAEASDPSRAYRLLDRAGRSAFVSAADWLESQAERMRPTTFAVGPATTAPDSPESLDVEVIVNHRPSLDPFVGLIPAQTHVTVRATREGGEWKVAASPRAVEAWYPPESGARRTALRWLDAARSCHTTSLAPLQAPIGLIGSPYWAALPCKERGHWTAGPIEQVDGQGVQPLVNAYGADVYDWARIVSIRGPKRSFSIALAPIGEAWRVMGVLADNGQVGG